MTKQETIAATCSALTDMGLSDALKLLGGGPLSPDETLVRSYLLWEVDTRWGEEAMEATMAYLGMLGTVPS